MPVGAVNVMFKVNVPASDCVGAVLRKNDPRLLLPLREPLPSAVVPVKWAVPEKVNCGTPVTVPVVEPERVTSSARATPWASVKRAMAKMLSASGFTIEKIRLVILLPPLFLTETLVLVVHSLFFQRVWRRSGACSLPSFSEADGKPHFAAARLKTVMQGI